MNDFYVDIGWKSILHDGEELCGDHVEIIAPDDRTQICVLADGLGSGVKACILSTLTSKIFSTMLAKGMPIEECVATIVDTLPVDQKKGVAYSTFTIVRIIDGSEAELIQFDNPPVLFLRGCNETRYPREEIVLHGKKMFKTTLKLREGDMFVLMSDGVTNASATQRYNYQWTGREIADFMKVFAPVGYTAKTMANMLAEECFRKYGEHPLDDATACIVCIKKRKAANIFFGPPMDREKEDEIFRRFLDSEGRHIVCGGTTAKIVGRILNRPVKPIPNLGKTDIPPMSAIEGIDLTTEGVVTLNRVSEYLEENRQENLRYSEWVNGRDGASRITRLLLEEATDICIFVGTAVNLGQEDGTQQVGFKLKMRIVKDIVKNLQSMGKRVVVEYC